MFKARKELTYFIRISKAQTSLRIYSLIRAHPFVDILVYIQGFCKRAMKVHFRPRERTVRSGPFLFGYSISTLNQYNFNKNLKDCLWKQRTHKRTKIGGWILLRLSMCVSLTSFCLRQPFWPLCGKVTVRLAFC